MIRKEVSPYCAAHSSHPWSFCGTIVYMPQIPLGTLLVAGILAAFAGIAGFATLPALVSHEPIDIFVSPEHGTYTEGDTFTIAVVVRSNEPINVFSGDMQFDPQIIEVDRIDYNTSIADLWAVEPWYQNGDGTLGFAGGTTASTGFTGEDTLLTITFRAISTGNAGLALQNARLLRHDGLGTEAHTDPTPIDTFFTIAPTELQKRTLAEHTDMAQTITVLDRARSLDLNGDGLDSIADMSIFMVHMSTQNSRSDFNQDGLVGMSDLSILLAGL